MSNGLDRYEELSRFLRTRRERMTPKLAGLPESGRRRTPGLRRSEVALLADVGLDWYTYLEQGRHINVSAEVLDRIAGALQLGESERRHLFHLARKQFPLIEIEKPPEVVPALQRFLDGQNLSPSNVMDARMNIIAWNAAYCALNGELADMSERERNFVWMTFTSPRFRYIKGDQWELHARRIAAKFHAEYARHVDDPWWSEQFEALCQASSEFREFWDSHEVLDAIDAPKALQCPNLGTLNFDLVSFQYLDNSNLTVSIHVPHQDGTVEKMQRLVSDYQSRRPGPFESLQSV
ncbi:MAG: helix-turn-helix transcriptional regulator [Paenibacillus macerans]|uniref:Helix-turn-helix domain-containing protein n=1 Tax=Paenibacillus macerans TaxID=44252 RepID=A0A6N8EL29_PAEMA|nr:helix-turn-helix transcriptional regulator [Paenibacillus macerans]MBS5910177.1 helix-turn-helix domain-containing protein [Paenibacillus macerans]MDU5946241.1 helix-turn-helix transcriptional regulator [Paenibacillus macerans]MDU7472393.1 helix-turn-helix transcriptional regulator [Paenibacillus macerans]MUG20976.1 helix-turn-helix domain-containing protein [Paenibacillus macerans]UMV48707.1 helix-turn-helix transcriptional regulator [Paenibacillus macerans]